jgi:RNA-directed DNA polymerase
MKVRYGEEVANHSGPESCGGAREGAVEALTGETGRPGIEPRNPDFGMPTLLSEAEGNTEQGDNRKSCDDPARSKIPCTPGSFLRRSWEISFGARAVRRAGRGR